MSQKISDLADEDTREYITREELEQSSIPNELSLEQLAKRTKATNRITKFDMISLPEKEKDLFAHFLLSISDAGFSLAPLSDDLRQKVTEAFGPNRVQNDSFIYNDDVKYLT